MAFESALAFTLRWEGGYVDDPDDHGGATNEGVTQSTYNAYRTAQGLAPQSVRLLTADERDDIYETRYWDAAGCPDLPEPIATALFDTAVNLGVTRAVKLLQGVVGVRADGVFGPLTLGATQKQPLAVTAQQLLAARWNFYRAVSWSDPTQQKFLKGWGQRVADLARTVGVASPVPVA